ncbi:hypothetical protein [Fimbriiglobus ruber]|uniref:Uncharacterized protein n=1 Tax=Fimbriiglobus ruber TaxID=1908690 RepID=A0A225DYT7_9BACT|nr:hypothetical protein [Fimbriiglobus ruber]OWK46690.1 hypothetical protein FRUB_00389 [Fimbriiglobus ruber]
MFCLIQIGLFVCGCIFVTKSRLRLGRQSVRAPVPLFMGLLLIAQLPIAIFTAFAFGVKEGYEGALKKKSQAQIQSRIQGMSEKYGLITELGIPAAAVAMAAVLFAINLKDEEANPIELTEADDEPPIARRRSRDAGGRRRDGAESDDYEPGSRRRTRDESDRRRDEYDHEPIDRRRRLS